MYVSQKCLHAVSTARANAKLVLKSTTRTHIIPVSGRIQMCGQWDALSLHPRSLQKCAGIRHRLRQCSTASFLALSVLTLGSYVLPRAAASFVRVTVSQSTPELPATARHFGCTPARFTGENRNLANVSLVLFEADKGSDHREACKGFAVTPEAKARYGGKVIMIMRGGCNFEQKWLVLKDLGAIGMIVVNNRQGAFPTTMMFGDGDNGKYDYWRIEANGIGYPACMTFYSEWERFAGLASVRLSFKHYAKYTDTSTEEKIPRNDITGVQISRLSGPPQGVPVAQATFNPQILNITKAHAFVLEWDPLCRAQSWTNQCTQCLKLESSIKDATSLRGKIAIMMLDRTSDYCFEWMYEIVARAQWAGAVGFLFVNYYDELFTYIPHQVPVNLTIPFVNVMNTYGSALIERVQTGQAVELTFPPFTYDNIACDSFSDLCIASGPAAVLQIPRMLGPTGIMVLTGTGESRILEVGQANFNPPSLLSAQDPASKFAINASVEYAEFNATCAATPDASLNASNPCEACYNDLNAALLNRAAIAGKVALFRSVDVRCVASYRAVVDVLTANAAVGVLVGSASESIYTMYAETGYTSSIPAFSIRSSNTDWIRERLASSSGGRRRDGQLVRAGGGGLPEVGEGLGGTRAVAGGVGVLALLPKLEQGGAVSYSVISGAAVENCPVKTARLSQLQVVEPPSLRQQLTAGGAAFNPPTWAGRQAMAVMARWRSCSDLTKCMQCDTAQCSDLINADHLQGNIMLQWEVDALCLTGVHICTYILYIHPYTCTYVYI